MVYPGRLARPTVMKSSIIFGFTGAGFSGVGSIGSSIGSGSIGVRLGFLNRRVIKLRMARRMDCSKIKVIPPLYYSTRYSQRVLR